MLLIIKTSQKPRWRRWPLYQILNEKFQRCGIFHENQSIDESMVPYFGHHSCKQFIWGKPVRFGYKIWMVASNTGLPYHVAIYQAKEKTVVKVTNPWVIALLHRHFPLVLILQITMFFSTASSGRTSSWRLLLQEASKERVPYEQTEQMVAHWSVSKNSRKWTEESISTLHQVIRLNWFDGTTIML